MKNFRKVLALVLVVATLFSFAAMTSAKTYEDADKISYEMAVDVLSAVGILNGYEDDTFKPTNTISREEMAKMIAVLANAGYDVSDLFASANAFADVEATRWSASYIAYCANAGIVAGRSAETFDPYGKVTGLETAKMLLVTLGFDAQEQGYVGANWKVNVLADAKVMGLTAGFAADYDIDAAITREEAAQMMLNALKAPAVVGVLSDNVIKVTNALIFGNVAEENTNAADFDHVTTYATLKDALKKGNWSLYGNVVISDDILHKTLFPGLKFNDGLECFARPATGFTYTVKGIEKASGNYFVGGGKAYTTQVDLKVDFKAEVDAKFAVEVIANGQKVTTYKLNNKTVDVYDYVLGMTGNGVDTVVYVEEGKITVNFIETFVGKVSNVDKYRKTFDIDYANETEFAEGVAIADTVKEGDIVLFRVCKADTHAKIYDAANGTTDWRNTCVHDYEVVTGKDVTVSYTEDWTGAKHPNSCKFKTTDGDVFYYNRNFNSIYDLPGVELKQGAKKTIYTDKYGYVMLITDQKAAAASVAYFEEKTLTRETVPGAYYDGKYNDLTVYTMQAAGYTGAAATVELAGVKAIDATDEKLIDSYVYRQENFAAGSLQAYTVNAKGHAVQSALASFIDATKTAKIGATTLNIYTNDTASAWLLTSKTDFIVRTMDAKTGDYTYTEIIGVENLPYTYGIDANKAQALDLNGDNVADYVFIDAEVVVNACEFIVLATTEKINASWDGVDAINDGNYKIYRALVNGVESLVASTATLDGAKLYTSNLAYVGVALAENDNLPLYRAATECTAKHDQYAIDLIDVVVIAEGEVRVTLKDFATQAPATAKWIKAIDELPVYYLVKADKDLNALTGVWTETNAITKQLTLSNDAYAYIVTNADGVATAIYVVTATWAA